MNPVATKILDAGVRAMIPAIVYGLGIVCPMVPSFLWTCLLNAIIGGDITTEHLQQFLKDHDIKTYAESSDFPQEKSNFNS